METMDRQELIYKGKVCPYCNKNTRLCDSSVIYGKSYGKIYLCVSCRAYVGVHKGTDHALGRLANSELRYWKKAAHAAFDPIWKRGIIKRKDAYTWLATELRIDASRCHIGMFDVTECKQVVEVCKVLNQ